MSLYSLKINIFLFFIYIFTFSDVVLKNLYSDMVKQIFCLTEQIRD